MNANAKKWVRALLSGRYKQGRHRLVILGKRGEPKQFCCLGVACELAVKAGITPPRKGDRYGRECLVLPRKVAEWLGLAAHGQFRDASGRREDLSYLNDRGVSFKRIAKILLREPEGLFKEASRARARSK